MNSSSDLPDRTSPARPEPGVAWALFFMIMPVAGVAVFVLAARGWPPLANAWLPPNVSQQGYMIDHLFVVIHWLIGVMFLLTGLLIAWCVWRYGARSGRVAGSRRHHTGLELLWSVGAGMILLFLAVYQWSAWIDNRIRPPMLETEVGREIAPPIARIVGRQFDWEYYYPATDDFAIDSATGIRSYGELVLPSGRDVVLQLESRDVIHSFFVRQLRLKQDMVPGMDHRVWFRAVRDGEFEILCAELCGWGHYQMRGRLRIVPPEEFDAWLAQLRASAAPAEEFAEEFAE